MKKRSVFLAAIAAVLLLGGTSFANGITHGSWEEFTGITSGTPYIENHIAATKGMKGIGTERGVDNVVTLNYALGEVTHGNVRESTGMKGATASSEAHYGIAPAWSEHEEMAGTTVKDYDQIPEFDLFLN